MRYCAISVCKNHSEKRPDLNFFRFSEQGEAWKELENLCRGADKEFESVKNLHICSEHFERKHILKTLSETKKLAKGTVPTILNPQKVPRSPSQREKRMNDPRK